MRHVMYTEIMILFNCYLEQEEENTGGCISIHVPYYISISLLLAPHITVQT